ncbi:MAG: hypothetical protein LAN71_04510 [Acidobacteriia bacterium]|nr:hypothetical protein [Terriglobia bacterium]
MSPEPTRASNTEWVPLLILLAVGAALFLFGARGFYLRGQFGWSDVVACALALIPAGLFLLISSYVFQHAKLVIIIPILFAVVTVRAYPAFGVALGLALAGIAASALWNERRDRRNPPAPISPDPPVSSSQEPS